MKKNKKVKMRHGMRVRLTKRTVWNAGTPEVGATGTIIEKQYEGKPDYYVRFDRFRMAEPFAMGLFEVGTPEDCLPTFLETVNRAEGSLLKPHRRAQQ